MGWLGWLLSSAVVRVYITSVTTNTSHYSHHVLSMRSAPVLTAVDVVAWLRNGRGRDEIPDHVMANVRTLCI